jgi:hypothetical protein
MIVSVVREHHWKPAEISGLFLDDEDHLGLIYWYNDVKECSKEVTAATQTPNS